MHPFSKTRFLSLSPKAQHKQCLRLLRALYKDSSSQSQYNELQQWMGKPPLSSLTREGIADRFHEHLKEAGLSLKEHNLLPHIRTQDLKQGKPPWPLAIYLDQIRSAHNVGSILRTTEAFSLGTIFFSEKTPFINNKQVQDTSMGTHAWVPCRKTPSLEELPRPLIALETCEAATPLHEFLFPPEFTLIIGNEEYGISETLLKKADHLITIPLRGRKNSLNVANAFAIAAAEIASQRMRS